MRTIHPTAVVAPGARIAENVVIEPYAVIDDDVEIADGCIIGSSTRLYSGTRLARGVRIFHGAAVGGDPQDLKFGGEQTEVNIGENTHIREFVTVHRGTKATGRTVIGSDCMLMAYSHVAHDCRVGNNVILANSVNLAGHVEIEDFAIVGGVVAIHQFVRVGCHAMIGGGYRVPKDVPPYILAAGYPLRYAGLNAIGLRRRGFAAETRRALKEVYRLAFQSTYNMSQALEQIRMMARIPEVAHVIAFMEKSKRGLLPGNRALASVSEDES